MAPDRGEPSGQRGSPGQLEPPRPPERGSVPRVSVTLPITLGQFLKAAGLVMTGGQAKQLVTAGLVKVNGRVETRRGRKLLPGDVVESEGRRVEVGAV